jgi:hypothetical protein
MTTITSGFVEIEKVWGITSFFTIFVDEQDSRVGDVDIWHWRRFVRTINAEKCLDPHVKLGVVKLKLGN